MQWLLPVLWTVLVKAACSIDGDRDWEIVHVVNGDSESSDAMLSGWLSGDVNDVAGNRAKVTLIYAGGTEGPCAFVKAQEDTASNVGSIINGLKQHDFEGDPNDLNTLVWATSFFSDSPDTVKTLTYLTSLSDLEFGTKVTQPNLSKGEMQCDTNTQPATRDQFVTALEAKNIKFIQISWATDLEEQRAVARWWKLNFFNHIYHKSWWRQMPPIYSYPGLIRPDLGLTVQEHYCLKNFQLTAVLDRFSTHTHLAQAYAANMQERMDCMAKGLGRSHSGTAYVIERVTGKCISKTRDGGSTGAAVGYDARAIEPNTDDSNRDDGPNVMTMIPYISNSITCEGSGSKVCVAVIIANEKPVFGDAETENTSLNCKHKPATPYYTWLSVRRRRQRFLFVVPPTDPDAKEIHEAWTEALAHEDGPQAYLAPLGEGVEAVTNRWMRILAEYETTPFERRGAKISDPKHDYEIIMIGDSTKFNGVHASGSKFNNWYADRYIDHGFWGAQAATCEYWLWDREVRFQLVEVKDTETQCVSVTPGPWTHLADVGGTWKPDPNAVTRASYRDTSCAWLRAIARVTQWFTPTFGESIRKSIIMSGHGYITWGDFPVELIQEEDSCERDTGCPTMEQFVVGFQLNFVTQGRLAILSDDLHQWGKVQTNVPWASAYGHPAREDLRWHYVYTTLTRWPYQDTLLACPEAPKSNFHFNFLTDSSQDDISQHDMIIAAQFLPSLLSRFAAHHGLESRFGFYSVGTLESRTCFVDGGDDLSLSACELSALNVPDPDGDYTHNNNFINAVGAIGSLQDLSEVNQLFYDTSKLFIEGSATSLSDKCPATPPTLDFLADKLDKVQLGLIVGVDHLSTADTTKLLSQWTFATRNMPKTGQVMNVPYSNRHFAYNAFRSAMASACGGTYDPSDTHEPGGGLGQSLMILLPIILGSVACGLLIFGGLLAYQELKPPPHLSFTMEADPVEAAEEE